MKQVLARVPPEVFEAKDTVVLEVNRLATAGNVHTPTCDRGSTRSALARRRGGPRGLQGHFRWLGLFFYRGYFSCSCDKLPCKGEPYRFCCYRDPAVQTDTQTSCYFYIRITKQSLCRMGGSQPHIEQGLGGSQSHAEQGLASSQSNCGYATERSSTLHRQVYKKTRQLLIYFLKELFDQVGRQLLRFSQTFH